MRVRLLSHLFRSLPLLCALRLHAVSVVEFAVTNLTVTEYDGVHYGLHQVLLTLTPPMSRLLGVTVAPAGGSAKVGPIGCTDCDYKFSNGGTTGRGNFQPDERFAVVNLVTRDDGLAEADETIVLELQDLPLGAVAGSRSNLVITLKDSGPSVGIGNGGSYEDEGNELTFLRLGDTNVVVSVQYAVTGGTATPGVDFQTALDGTVTFAPGERTQRVSLNSRDGIVDAAYREWFTVRLADPPPGVELFNREAVIEIFDAQLPTTLDLSYIPPFQGAVQAVARRADGKLAVINPSYELLLLDPDGSLDRRVPHFSGYHGESLVWQANGKLLATGWHAQGGDQILHRFLPDGSRDPEFSVPAVLSEIGVNALAVSGDGSIYVGSAKYQKIRRLKPDGSEDTGFHGPIVHELWKLVVDAADRLVVVGTLETTNGLVRSGLFRLAAKDGLVEVAFHPTFESESGSIHQVVPQSDGKLLVTGRFTAVNGVPYAGLARLNVDGSTDTSFRYADTSAGGLGPASVTLQNDGSLFVVNGDGDLQRLGPDGELLRATPVRAQRGDHDRGVLIAVLLPDGMALIAGSFSGSDRHKGLARVLLEGAPRTALAITSLDPLGVENQENIRATVTRLGDVTAAARVLLNTRDRTARAGQDYNPLAVTLEFAPFEQEKEVQIELLDDHTLEGDETFEVVLSDATGAEKLGPPKVVTLLDNEDGFPPGAITHRADGGMELIFQSLCCPAPVVEVSSDLIHWAPAIGEVIFQGNNRYRMVDDPASDVPTRFYRVRSRAEVAKATARPDR